MFIWMSDGDEDDGDEFIDVLSDFGNLFLEEVEKFECEIVEMEVFLENLIFDYAA